MTSKVAGLLLTPVLLLPSLRADCVPFPPNFIPFTSIYYVTPADSAGDQLVVGLPDLAGARPNIPLPSSTNETFCDASVQLAPGQFYPSVYIPTAAELTGNFAAFTGLLVDPATGQPFSGGVIPASRFTSVFAIRIGPATVSQAVKPWSLTGPTSQARYRLSAVILPSGKVMVIGDSTLVEIYDPLSGTFTPAGNTLVNHGDGVTATVLNDGRVFIVGGSGPPNASEFGAQNVAEFFDPASGTFSAITATTIQPHGVFHTADLLPDGRVLIVGGLNGSETNVNLETDSGAELFDPKGQTFTLVPSLAVNRRRHTTNVLPDGRVLVIGGLASGGNNDIGPIEVFDPTTSRFSILGFTLVGRVSHVSSLLPDGRVLIAAGFDPAASAEIFDPSTGKSVATGSLSIVRPDASASVLPNGQVLVIGGGDSPPPPAVSTAYNTAELYSPASGTFAPAGAMSAGRQSQTSLTLPNGRVMVIDGAQGDVNLNSVELYTPVTQGLVPAQTGVTFRAAQGIASVPSQTIPILSPSDTIPWSVSVKTYSGGNWLSATPASSTSSPGSPVSLTISVDPTGLNAQTYYGAITLTPTDKIHAAVSITVVFNIVPAGTPAPLQVSPSGLVFSGVAGTSLAPQSVAISNFTSRAINFSATSSATFFSFSPPGGTITKTLPGNVTVTPSNLAAGVYRGSLKLAFSDSSSQTVDILLVISVAPSSSSAVGPYAIRAAAAACTPSKLLPVLTSIAAGSSTPVAWPSPLSVQVLDDCSNAINNGSVIASFTNGDPPIGLTNIGGGVWTGTWVPQRITLNTSVRVDTRTLQPALSGTVQVAVQVASNPNVPIVAAGGILSSGDYTSPPAAGLLVSVFGSALADGSLGFSSAPLPPQLGSTQVLLGGVNLPLLFASENQVNVLIPYETPLNVPLALLVVRNGAISVPVTTAVFSAEPAILSTAGNGTGQGHIYRASTASQTLADASSPATAGDVLVIYAVGLGVVAPAVVSGDPAPSSPLASVPDNVTVTIGGQSNKPIFAGLTPGYVGLYQLNVVVPPGITPGAQVPVTVSVGGKSSAGGIYMAIK